MGQKERGHYASVSIKLLYSILRDSQQQAMHVMHKYTVLVESVSANRRTFCLRETS